MKTFMKVCASLFGMLTVVFYILSIRVINMNDIGLVKFEIANMQGTVYTAACAIICAINIVGILVLTEVDNIINKTTINGTKNNEIKTTNNSDKPEIKSVFSRNTNVPVNTEPKKKTRSQWICSKCNSLNSCADVYCSSCGAYKGKELC